ncbi:hypothetical protein KY362_01275, partial [Candidatus Woesearchaeota archaeon]|nr:hypothetical protein [Candidatus Woesearchaeota archaeon]
MAGQEINEALISKIINRMYSEGVDSDDVGSGIPGLQPAKPPQPGLSDDVPEVSATEDSSAQEYGDDVHRSVHTVPLLEEHGLDKDGLPDR